MPNILIIGATRGLGASLANAYAAIPTNTVYGTTRSPSAPSNHSPNINWVPNIDLNKDGVGQALVNQLGQLGVAGGMVEGKEEVRGFDVVIITAGYFVTEDFENGPKWEEEIRMYSISPFPSSSSPHLSLLSC
jgi:NAD(P)-dependent dehydrogenase (short-subunit alcohol dehydrogenase family)